MIGRDSCPMCRARGVFRRARDVDAEINKQPSRCPYVRERTGVVCQWVGRYDDMPSHVHCFPDAACSTEEPSSSDG